MRAWGSRMGRVGWRCVWWGRVVGWRLALWRVACCTTSTTTSVTTTIKATCSQHHNKQRSNPAKQPSSICIPPHSHLVALARLVPERSCVQEWMQVAGEHAVVTTGGCDDSLLANRPKVGHRPRQRWAAHHLSSTRQVCERCTFAQLQAQHGIDTTSTPPCQIINAWLTDGLREPPFPPGANPPPGSMTHC